MKGAAAAASGIVFCGCAWLGMAHAQSSAGPTLPVAVNGKRVKTIDVHAHCLFHEAATLMGDDNAAFRATVKGAPEAFIAIETRLKAMDAMAVDMEVLSINPFWYSKERDLAAEIVRIQNEKLAELCAAQPDRFAAFASLALQYPDLAVQQLETAVKKQGLRGAAIGGSVAGTDFADAKLDQRAHAPDGPLRKIIPQMDGQRNCARAVTRAATSRRAFWRASAGVNTLIGSVLKSALGMVILPLYSRCVHLAMLASS